MRWWLVLGLWGCGDDRTELDRSKQQLAKVTVDKLANEHFPRWSLSSGTPCPQDIGELAKLGGIEDHDPWGTPYKLQCGTVPAGTPKGGIAVSSAGPDKAHDTADDIVSWKR